MIVYEDGLVVAKLAENAAAKGHVVICPKRAATRLGELSKEESAHLFTVANYTAAILFQGLKAEGTNILCNEDEGLLAVHVIARGKDDGLDFQWQPQSIDQNMMDDAFERLKDKAFAVGRRAPEKAAPEPVPAGKPPHAPERDPEGSDEMETIKRAEDKENYLIKQLLRVP